MLVWRVSRTIGAAVEPVSDILSLLLHKSEGRVESFRFSLRGSILSKMLIAVEVVKSLDQQIIFIFCL